MKRVDRRLDEALRHLGRTQPEAFVLCIGAMDGVSYDGTRGYVGRYGWKGLFVEPIPALFERLVTSYAGRSGVMFENAAVTDHDGVVEMMTIPIEVTDRGLIHACFAGMSTLLPPRNGMGADPDKELVERYAVTITVPAVTLETLLTRHQVTRVDVLQIDVAGYEWMVFQQFDLRRFQPRVVRVSWTSLTTIEQLLVTRRLQRHEYQVAVFHDEIVGLLGGTTAERAPCASEPAADHALADSPSSNHGDVVLYVITYNAPEQLRLWLESVAAANPELLHTTVKYLLNNSIDERTFTAYDRLCEEYGFTQIRKGNLGVNGGRLFCARHFEALPRASALLWFEDDMLLHPPGAGLCRNGLRTHVPDLLEKAKAIVRIEQLDYLKLSFTEFFGDHHLNWAWYNVPGEVRHHEFPEGTHRTKIDHTGVYADLSYVVGEVHYSNWPLLMTKGGNYELFLKEELVHPFEQTYMSLCFQMMRRGEIKAGALLASPVNHHRVVHYPAAERKEC